MPYIHYRLRERYERFLKLIDQLMTLHPGHLNYIISKLCHIYITRKGLSYRVINEVIGVLECAKLELYRMIAAPYEDKKLLDNGCISELDKRSHWTDNKKE